MQLLRAASPSSCIPFPAVPVSFCRAPVLRGRFELVLRTSADGHHKWHANSDSRLVFTCEHGCADRLNRRHHGSSKSCSILFAPKVQPPHLFGIPPLMEVCCGLIIFHPSYNGTVDHHLQSKGVRAKYLATCYKQLGYLLAIQY